MRAMGSLVLVLVSMVGSASAGELTVRDVRGDLVRLDGTEVVVAWSLESADPEALSRLADARRVVAVNTDPVGSSSRILPWVKSHRLEVTVVADPDGTIRDRLARVRSAPAGDVLAIDRRR